MSSGFTVNCSYLISTLLKNHEIGHRLCQTWNVSTTVVGHIKFPSLPSRLVTPVPSDCYSGRLSSHLHRGNLRATPRCENIVVGVFFSPASLLHPYSSPRATRGEVLTSGGTDWVSSCSLITQVPFGGHRCKQKSFFENPGAFCHKFCFGSING